MCNDSQNCELCQCKKNMQDAMNKLSALAAMLEDATELLPEIGALLEKQSTMSEDEIEAIYAKNRAANAARRAVATQ